MASHISLDMDRTSVNSSAGTSLSQYLEITSTPYANLQISKGTISFSQADENQPSSGHIYYDACAGASELITQARGQNRSEDQISDGILECRICQEEDKRCNLEIPCSCCGSMKYAHRMCLQHWCNEKGDTTCEICYQPYQSGYVIPSRPPPSDDTPLNFSRGEWGLTGGPQREFHVLAISGADEYAEFSSVNASAAACCRSAALVLMAILLLRHAFAMASARGDEDASTIFAVFLLRAAGFLLPCYIMARILNTIHRRRQRQDVTMATTEVAVLLRGQNREMFFTVPPGPP